MVWLQVDAFLLERLLWPASGTLAAVVGGPLAILLMRNGSLGLLVAHRLDVVVLLDPLLPLQLCLGLLDDVLLDWQSTIVKVVEKLEVSIQIKMFLSLLLLHLVEIADERVRFGQDLEQVLAVVGLSEEQELPKAADCAGPPVSVSVALILLTCLHLGIQSVGLHLWSFQLCTKRPERLIVRLKVEWVHVLLPAVRPAWTSHLLLLLPGQGLALRL